MREVPWVFLESENARRHFTLLLSFFWKTFFFEYIQYSTSKLQQLACTHPPWFEPQVYSEPSFRVLFKYIKTWFMGQNYSLSALSARELFERINFAWLNNSMCCISRGKDGRLLLCGRKYVHTYHFFLFQSCTVARVNIQVFFLENSS